jgi:hypothetical protein
LCPAYTGLGFDTACGHDEVFQASVLDRVIEPVSKLDSIRVLDEIGIVAPSYRPIVYWRYTRGRSRDSDRVAVLMTEWYGMLRSHWR